MKSIRLILCLLVIILGTAAYSTLVRPNFPGRGVEMLSVLICINLCYLADYVFQTMLRRYVRKTAFVIESEMLKPGRYSGYAWAQAGKYFLFLLWRRKSEYEYEEPGGRYAILEYQIHPKLLAKITSAGRLKEDSCGRCIGLEWTGGCLAEPEKQPGAVSTLAPASS